MLALHDGDEPRPLVEHQAAGGGRALVDRHHVVRGPIHDPEVIGRYRTGFGRPAGAGAVLADQSDGALTVEEDVDITVPAQLAALHGRLAATEFDLLSPRCRPRPSPR
ncbi:hypothetical protein GCM10023214_46540 [Amycolatopsis dongchuanensis]|uniref:Uncharacterized protein n=1 Tax=Amycolatopsis dongchuanensis TaxID=1070866 RepID=A0ABP9QZ04_9PSEU